jgi:hypothetical protein
MYLEINSNNQVMGYSDNEISNSVKTEKEIPEFTDTQILKFVDGDFVVEDSQTLIDKKAEWTAQEYARNRASAYDSVGDQLDMMMKDMRDGTTTHQTACEAVKAKYPKPE